MKCDKCKKEIRFAYGVWKKEKKQMLNLCWDCYQKAIKVGKKKKNNDKEN